MKGLLRKENTEPPVPLYVGLRLHSRTRSKVLVSEMSNLGISISYARVLQIESQLSASVIEQMNSEGVVCPRALRKGLFTVGAIDNIDYDPSLTSSVSSFHGTGISLFQSLSA